MAVLLLALPLPASQETIPDQPFAESIDVSVASVEVAVTDREGRHVQGLGRGDFDLFVDGRKVEIVNFSELAEGAPAAAKEPALVPPPDAAPGSPPPRRLLPRNPPPSRSWCSSTTTTPPADRNRVLRQVQELLDSILGARDRVMVVTHEQGIHVRRSLSAGRESLAADLRKLEKLAARGVIQGSHSRRTLQMHPSSAASAPTSRSRWPAPTPWTSRTAPRRR